MTTFRVYRFGGSASVASASLAVAVVISALVVRGGASIAVTVFAGATVALAIARRPEVGAALFVALLASFPRDTLFQAGLPILNGSIKVTDLILAWTIFMWIASRLVRPRSGRSAGRTVPLAVGAIVVMAGGSLVTAHAHGVATKLSLTELRPMLAFLLVFPIVDLVRTPRDLQLGLYAFLAGSTVLSGVTIFMYLRGEGTVATYADGALRVNATPFAIPAVALIWGFVLLSYTKDIRGRALAGGVMAMSAAGLLLTFRRGGWIGVLAALLLVIVLLPSRRRALLAVSLLAAALVLVPAGGGAIPLHAAVQRFESIGAGDADLSARYRVVESRVALATWRRHPLAGIGLGNGLGFNDPRYTPGAGYNAYWVHPYIHDSYLWYAVKLGTPALLLLLLVLARTIGGALRVYRRGREVPIVAPLSLGIAATVGALSLMSFTDAHFNSVNVTAYVAAAIAGAQVLRRSRRA